MQIKYDKNNIFYKILKKELPSTIIYEDDKVLCFKDINPQAPIHLLVIPKAEYICFDDFVAKSSSEDIAYFFKKVQEIAKSQGLSDADYRIVANCGEGAGQIVHHFHIHIMGYK